MEVFIPDFNFVIDGRKSVRKVSDMMSFWNDKDAAQKAVDAGDPLVYEVYACETTGEGELSYALTILYPGKVGQEFYMTKGHFHQKLTGEVYLCLRGKGKLVLENREGNTRVLEMSPGKVTYVPAGFAHRSVNTGKENLEFMAVYNTDAGHDYGSIERDGFKELITKE
jgi:glucose-6-phosphate isomerase, archaeal